MDRTSTNESFTEVMKGSYMIGEYPLMTGDISSCVCIAMANPRNGIKGMAHILGEDFKNSRFKAGIGCLVEDYLAAMRKNIPCFQLCEAEVSIVGGDFNCNSELDENILVLLSYRNSGKAEKYLRDMGADAKVMPGNKYARKDVFLSSGGTLRVEEKLKDQSKDQSAEEEAALTYDEIMLGLAGGLTSRKERKELLRELHGF